VGASTRAKEKERKREREQGKTGKEKIPSGKAKKIGKQERDPDMNFGLKTSPSHGQSLYVPIERLSEKCSNSVTSPGKIKCCFLAFLRIRMPPVSDQK